MARSQFCFRPFPISRKKYAAGNLRKWTLPRSRVPISKQHYREVAAHYRQLSVEHLDYQAQREIAD
jgi:hypothetical protein